MENKRYAYSPAITRKAIKWPNEALLAVWIIPNIEHFELDMSFKGGPVPDVPSLAMRDYGNRRGIWRLMDVLDKYRLRATVALNASVCEHYPMIIEEGKGREWEFMGHGITNSRQLVGLAEEEERQVIRTALKVIGDAVGKRPEGWLSPGLNETYNTPDILAEEGIRYLCDWCNDDQPYPMTVREGRLLSIPYSHEINDMPAFMRYHLSPEDFLQKIKDQFDVLYEEGAVSGQVMAIALHPFLIGQPFRIRYLDKALEYITGPQDVWFATGSEIAHWYTGHCL